MNRQFDYANVKNPEYFCDGRMEAYSDHAYYASCLLYTSDAADE